MLKIWNLDLDSSPRFNHGDNRLVFRLADVFLMAAECENELNGTANAYQYSHSINFN
ncbi:RagB/SusD family nutrient uptake outer membrane protein [Aestuariivivens sediminis]|uniref:RagB/SusD family nutrient uptake outer membrane protein n=1 Tax=Aestuariivivens sediminis TaxID=2913557 RepID=UPI001F5A4D09|nr:RagB/SusD family nutrient uptake outer membrane protein [Aestuariivivens sediminis]